MVARGKQGDRPSWFLSGLCLGPSLFEADCLVGSGKTIPGGSSSDVLEMRMAKLGGANWDTG